MSEQMCYALPGKYIIDTIGEDGLTSLYKKNEEQVLTQTPDAVKMTVDQYVKDKIKAQNHPLKWEETTREKYDEMLCVLPPKIMRDGAFLVGEPMDHSAKTGKPRFECYHQFGAKFFVSSRPITLKEFAEIFN